jgi:hypothetical protein
MYKTKIHNLQQFDFLSKNVDKINLYIDNHNKGVFDFNENFKVKQPKKVHIENLLFHFNNEYKHNLTTICNFEIKDFIDYNIKVCGFENGRLDAYIEYESLHKKSFEKVLNKKPKPDTAQNQNPTEIEKDKMYFKIGLLFAENKIYKKIVQIEKFKTTKYYYLETEFSSVNSLAKHLKLTRQYISETFNNNDKTSKNIYSNLRQMNNIIEYCKNKNIDIHKDFLENFNKLNQKQ